MSPFLYFWFFGCFDLLLMARTDIRELWIDDRLNYYMFGIVGSLIALAGRPITLILVLLGIAIFIRIVGKKAFAEGDRTILQWSIVGIGILGFSYLYIYFIFLIIYLLIQIVLKKLYSIDGQVAGVPVLFGAFMTTGIIYELTWSLV